MSNNNGMYPAARTWNPFKGCKFDCIYCEPTFKRQSKRQKHLCSKCYRYDPHEHAERLAGPFPSEEIIFVAGNGDLAFASNRFIDQIVEAIGTHSKRCPEKQFYLQSKQPKIFKRVLGALPESVILVTTLETNRNAGYRKISQAPLPQTRFKQFLELDYPRKVVTVEPIMDFDLVEFSMMLQAIKPEYIWIGFNSHDKTHPIPEPSEKKVEKLIGSIQRASILVKGKKLRGVTIPSVGAA